MNRSAAPALLLACVTALAAPARAEIKTQWVDYNQGGTALQGYLAYDDAVSGKRPGVLLLHRRDGMSELTLQNAKMYAAQGYVVLAADIFGKDVRPKTVDEEKAQSALYGKDRPLMRARALAGLEALKANPLVEPGKIAIVGYCFGGTVAIELAETGVPLLGTVTIHGSFRGFAPEAAKKVSGRVLILHGSEDPVAPMSEVVSLVDQLRAANVRWELNLYSGTQHGFSTPKNPAEQRANEESKFATKRFFKDVLGL
ncbi:MAG TPA: dienelactone hydrolase family protein [Xanthobacteraceae bacterium]|nr:dienelactone hydrolase family protein [Xanthobacteraceae bacterium]